MKLVYNCTQAVEEKIITPVEKLQSVKYSKDLLSLVQYCSSIGGCRQNWSGSSKRFPLTVYSGTSGGDFLLLVLKSLDFKFSENHLITMAIKEGGSFNSL